MPLIGSGETKGSSRIDCAQERPGNSPAAGVWIAEALEAARAFAAQGMLVGMLEAYSDESMLENGTVSESELAVSKSRLATAKEELSRAELHLCAKFSSEDGEPFSSDELARFLGGAPSTSTGCWECGAASGPGVDVAQYCGRCVTTILQAAGDPEVVRNDKDYAIEHGEYLAQSAEHLLTQISELQKIELAIEEGTEPAPKESVDATRVAAQSNQVEAVTGLRGAICVFRKRRDQARAHTAGQSAVQIQQKNTDDFVVETFAQALKARIAKYRAERLGWSDDLEQRSAESFSVQLHESVRRGDPLDVALSCMMLRHHCASITPLAQIESVPAAFMYRQDSEFGRKLGPTLKPVNERITELFDGWTETTLIEQGTSVRGVVVPLKLASVGLLISTENRRGTDQPLFAVMAKTEVVTHPDYDHDYVVWVETRSGDHRKPSKSWELKLEKKYAAGEDTPGWSRFAIKEVDTFVTACFTEQGCKQFLAIDGHNHRKPFIHAFGSYRNDEYRSVRNWLLSLGAVPC